MENNKAVETSNSRVTALFDATQARDVRAIRSLLSDEHNVDVNAKNSDGLTPLLVAIANNDARIVSVLFDAGADPGIKDDKGRNALHYAYDFGFSGAEMIEAMVHRAKKEDINCKAPAMDDWRMQDQGDQMTPLHMMARLGNRPGVNSMLKHGAQVDATTSAGKTPLHSAVEGKDSSEQAPYCVDALLAAKADPMARDDKGRTPLHLAVLGLNVLEFKPMKLQIMQSLIRKGADVMASDNEGLTPLALLRKEGKLPTGDIAEFLEKAARRQSQRSVGRRDEQSLPTERHGGEAEQNADVPLRTKDQGSSPSSRITPTSAQNRNNAELSP